MKNEVLVMAFEIESRVVYSSVRRFLSIYLLHLQIQIPISLNLTDKQQEALQSLQKSLRRFCLSKSHNMSQWGWLF